MKDRDLESIYKSFKKTVGDLIDHLDALNLRIAEHIRKVEEIADRIEAATAHTIELSSDLQRALGLPLNQEKEETD